MSALASIFGALAGLGNTGQQLGEAKEFNRQKAVQTLAAAQKAKFEDAEITDRQQDAKLKLQEFIQKQNLAKQPIMVTQPYTAADGKQHATFLDPTTNQMSDREVPGPLPETKEQTEYRGLSKFMTPDEAKAAIQRKIDGKPTLHMTVEPDKNFQTGYAAVYKNTDGTEAYRTMTVAPARDTPRETRRRIIDQYGNVTYSDAITEPLLGGGSTVPKFSGPGTLPGATAPRRGAPSAGAASSVPIPSAVGTYKGLDDNGQIPDHTGLNPQVVQFANDILNGADAHKDIPVKARAQAELVAKAYGWKGQGSLTPKDQAQIQQADTALARLLDEKLLKAAFSSWNHFVMAGMPAEEPAGGAGRIAFLEAKKTLSPEAREFYDNLQVMRSVIQSFKKFTGGSQAEGQTNRYLNELTDAASTTDVNEAKYKLKLLQSEINVAKRYGYFPRQDASDKRAPVTLMPLAGEDSPLPSAGAITVSPGDMK